MRLDSLRRSLLVLSCFVALMHGAAAAVTEQRLADGLAMSRANRPADALPLLESCLTDLAGDERRRVVNRLIGHAYWDLALANGNQDERLRLLDKARDCYLLAGDDGDTVARRHFLAHECAQSAERGYAAGWRYISWNGVGAVDGWIAVLGNYGAAMTGGKGIPGLIELHPLHALVWGVLIAGLLLLAVTGLLRKPQALSPLVPQRAPPPGKRPSNVDNQALPRRRPAPDQQPAPALRGVKSAVPPPAASTRTPVPSSTRRPPRPDLNRLRDQHLGQTSAEKRETQAYNNVDSRRLDGHDDERESVGPVRKSNRDETEPGGNLILPPVGRQPPRRPQ